MEKIKTILISQFALPFDGIGSWTTMYNYYLNTSHQIDIILCPAPSKQIEGITYYSTTKSLIQKLNYKFFTKNRYKHIFRILKKIIKNNQKYIIQIVDNHGLVVPINSFLEGENLRSNCYLQFLFHGFPPFYGNFESRPFFEALDEHVMLTNDSYMEYKKLYTQLPCSFSILPNGVDSKVFFKLNYENKLKQRDLLNMPKDKLVFVWCSKDTPKKGLNFILKVWKELITRFNNIELWVIGTERTISIPNVKVVGLVPNKKLAKFYQAADFYLFPTLWHEGFGLSLLEALKCGCYCIASNNGGVGEVLNYGEYGRLIERPNFVEDWVKEIEHSMEDYIQDGNSYLNNIPDNFYELEDWSKNMNRLINNAKKYV